MPNDKTPNTTDKPDPGTDDVQDAGNGAREAQAEDPTSPERGFEHPDYSDAEPE
jgi:hypothetical protein